MNESISLRPTPDRQIVVLMGWLVFCFSASAAAVFVTTGGWYAGLNKPSWNPPAWVFGPVWTTLYAMMAVAAWLVWRKGGWKVQRKPLILFLFQWLLNTLWTPLFFGLHLCGVAFFELAVLWLALGVTLIAFWSASRLAGILLIPYFLWVSFAAFLNWTIWRLNG